MANIFNIDMLPAHEGDCLWIEYGDDHSRHRILIDGGRGRVGFDACQERLRNAEEQREFELVISTHVDADHIEGLLRIVEDDNSLLTFQDFWFNGFQHLTRPAPGGGPGFGPLGGVQGETLTTALQDKQLPWNRAFGGGAVVVPDAGPLPSIQLPGGMTITLLSPTWEKLEKMRPVWEREVRAAGLIPGGPVEAAPALPVAEPALGPPTVEEVEDLAASEFDPDRSEANGTSIMIVAEFAGKRALLTGDGHMQVLGPALDAYVGNDDTRRKFDVFKISHHGSKGTVSGEVLQQLDCQRYLISTNGSRHKHPNREAIARILKFGGDDKQLLFNYESDFSTIWSAPTLRNKFRYEAIYPDGEPGVRRVELI